MKIMALSIFNNGKAFPENMIKNDTWKQKWKSKKEGNRENLSRFVNTIDGLEKELLV